MKLASMGLRGVAVNILWMQALEHQKNENYDKLAQTLQTLTKVQPNFVKSLGIPGSQSRLQRINGIR